MGRPPKACDESKKRVGRPTKRKEELLQRTGFDGNPVAPWRKTVPLITQAVTTTTTGRRSDNRKSMPDTTVKKLAGSAPTKPYPVFWAKALEGLKAYSPRNPTYDRIDLENDTFNSDSLRAVSVLKPACSVLDDEATTATVINTLHNPQQPGVFGQNEVKEGQHKKGFLYNCDANQPLVSKITITPEDVSAQEKRVIDARKRLQEAMKHFG